VKLKVNAVKVHTTEDGTAELTLAVDPISRGAVKSVVADARKALEVDGVLSCELKRPKKRRTLPQNALLWRLLTIYAETINGGRMGDITPEKIYYAMLERYGVAVFVAVPDICIDDLRKAYRKIKIIDETVIERNGKRTPAKTVKCILGSSKYNTEQMKKLIDGIFDELAMLGVDCDEEVYELYQDWQEASVKNG
jgi:hypothetical protein